MSVILLPHRVNQSKKIIRILRRCRRYYIGVNFDRYFQVIKGFVWLERFEKLLESRFVLSFLHT